MRLALLVGLLAVSVGGAAEAQTASASVSPNRPSVGDRVTYTLRVRGGLAGPVAAPSASGALRLASPYPTLDLRSSVNGEQERTLAWSYQAVRAGVGRIGALRVRAGGTALSVAAVTVSVSAAPTAPPTTAPAPTDRGELFVRAEPSRRTAVVGQQVVVDYVLYFEANLQPRQTTPVGTWDAAGFWREELDVPTAYPRPVTLGGKPYEAVTIRSIALFPTRTGTLELAPMTFQIDLLRVARSLDQNDPFAPFFSPFASRYTEEEVTAPTVEIAVETPPAGAPATFGGSVGQFTIESQILPTDVEVGEPIQVEVTLRGTGNVATLTAPTLDVPPSFDAYDPREERDLDRRADPLEGWKRFTYTLVPQSGGTFDVPPAVWTYYDPADGRYKTLRTNPARVTVRGEALADVATPTDPNAPAGLLADADWRGPGRPVAVWWGLLGGGLAVPALALAALAGLGRRRTPRKAREARGARPNLRSQVRGALSLQGPAAWAALDGAVREGIAQHTAVAAPVLSRRALAEGLATRGVPADLGAQLLVVLDACERGQYAPGLGGEGLGAVAAQAEGALADLAAVTAPPKQRFRPRRRSAPAA